MRRLYRKLAFNYSEGGLGMLLQKSISFALNTLYSESLWNIYIHKGFEDLDPRQPLLQCKTLTYQNLLDARYFKVVAFPEEIRLRFDRRNTCYGFYLNENLATIGWSSDGYLELDRGVVFPCPSEVALFDFMTLPEFRGHGIYTNALRYLINNIPKSATRSVYIAVDPNNAASVRGIQRAGFSPLLCLSRRKILGVAFNSRHPAQSNRFAGESTAG
jgi:GNAT acetyltransferase-like protein